MREAQRRAERSISTGVRDRPAAQPEEEVRGCGERSRAVCRAPRGVAQVGRVVMLPHPRMDSGRNEEAAVRCAAARSGARSAFFYRKSGVGGWGGGAGGKHGAAAAVTSPRGVASVPAQLPRREPPGGGYLLGGGAEPVPAGRAVSRRLSGPAAVTFVCPRPARPPPAPGTFPLGGGRARTGHVTAALPAAALTSPPTSAGAAAPPPRTKERPLRHEQRRDGQVQHLSRRGQQ